MTPGAVDGDAEQLGVVLLELRQDLVVERHLVAADRAPVGRIERQHDGPAAEVRERDRLIRSGVQLEIRRGRADWSKSGVGRSGHDGDGQAKRSPAGRSECPAIRLSCHQFCVIDAVSITYFAGSLKRELRPGARDRAQVADSQSFIGSPAVWAPRCMRCSVAAAATLDRAADKGRYAQVPPDSRHAGRRARHGAHDRHARRCRGQLDSRRLDPLVQAQRPLTGHSRGDPANGQCRRDCAGPLARSADWRPLRALPADHRRGSSSICRTSALSLIAGNSQVASRVDGSPGRRRDGADGRDDRRHRCPAAAWLRRHRRRRRRIDRACRRARRPGGSRERRPTHRSLGRLRERPPWRLRRLRSRHARRRDHRRHRRDSAGARSGIPPGARLTVLKGSTEPDTEGSAM